MDKGKIVKVLQLLSVIFMAVMLAIMVFLMIKYNISPANAAELSKYLQGGVFTVILILIVFSAVKSFALVFPPSLLFTISGIFFDNYWGAVTVNFVATFLSLFLPYFLGRFTGMSFVDSLKQRFPKIKRIDDFAGANEFLIIFIVKASGLLPSDLSSVLFGAMNMNFKKYVLAANLGLIPVNILWTLLGNKGDVSNPLSLLYILPIPVFTIVATIIMKNLAKKSQNANQGE